jgi:hypothetical protein
VKLDNDTAYFDSGASHHMIANWKAFTTYTTDAYKCNIEMANGQVTDCPGKGIVYVKTKMGAPLKLKCLHVPQLVGNLISTGRFYCRGCNLVCTGGDNNRYDVVSKGQTLFKAQISKSNVFLIKLQILKGKSFDLVKLLSKLLSDIEKLHRHAGHPGNDSLRKMFDLPPFELVCKACSMSKSHRLPFSNVLPESSHCLESIHFDLSGRIDPPTPEAYEYYFKITDHFLSDKFFIFSKRNWKPLYSLRNFMQLLSLNMRSQLRTLPLTEGASSTPMSLSSSWRRRE